MSAIATVAALAAAQVHAPSPPRIDKSKVETYLRYADGYTPQVNISIDDPAPGPFPGYYRLVVHLSAGQQKFDRVYYLTGDGEHVIAGNVWDLNMNPFRDNLEHLPASGPSYGPVNAPVTIVVFSDFECPYCRSLAQTIRANVAQKYPSEVRVIFADFPINAIHPWARAAAEAAHCIGDANPSAFWAFHDWIFDHQQEIDSAVIPTKEASADLGKLREKLIAYVNEKHLDAPKVMNCIDTHQTAPAVAENERRARMVQVQETPTLFVNGRMIPGAVQWNQLDAIIKMELHRPREVPASNTEACCSVSIPGIRKK